MPSWAPDGRTIYFDGTHGGDWAGIESIPAEGGSVTRVPLPQKHEYLQPTYPSGGLEVSSDGKLLCFAGFYRRGEGEAGIFRLPINGGNPSRLTGTQPRDQEPTWSPDGRSIAFIRPEQLGSDVSIWNIFVVPSEGGMPNRISRPEDSVQMASVRIAPDGKLIAFFGRDSTLRIIPASGGSSRILVSGLGGDIRFQGISWSPDGNTLAYVSGENLWKVPLKGGDPTRIETGLDARISKIDWSPDGKTITFSAFKGGEHQLWLMEGFLPVVKTER